MTDPGTGGVVPKVVISYARADSTRVLEFVQLLEGAGIGAWVDHEDITGAQLWAGEIAEAIDGCAVVVFFASPRAVASPSVVRELALAFEGRKDILPLYLEDVELPPAMRYQLAGVQRIELYEGTDAASRLPAVLRSLERLGVVPAPAGTTPAPVTRALEADRSPTPPAAIAASTGGTVARLPRRAALIAAVAAVVVAGIVGVILAGGGDDDPEVLVPDARTDETDGGDASAEGAFPVAAGDLLYVYLPGPLEPPLSLRRTADAENDENIITEHPQGTGLHATGAAHGSWVEVTSNDGATGWVDSNYLGRAAGFSAERRGGLVESLGYAVVGDPVEGLDGLVILKGALDDQDLGHLELVFFFVGDDFIGVDGYPSHEIVAINPDTNTPGAAVTYHLFDGPGTRLPKGMPDGYPSTYFHARSGQVFPDPTNVVYPIDPRLAEVYGVEDLGAELGHR